jgi:LysR family transcriptional regulator, hydrogen peroxide-inducible genes activator
MEMHEVRYFLAVCDTLNFTRAAERCNVSQPSLTRAIQKLEAEFGGLLFRRERATTHLTDLGSLVRPQLERIAQDAEAVKTTANSFLRMKDAPLSFGIMCTIGPLRCVGFLSRFQKDHPGIDLTLTEDTPVRLTELLQEGKIDVAVMAQPDPFPERFDVHLLYRENFVVAFPPGHRFDQMNAVRIADVGGESYLSRINCEYYDQLGQVCRDNNAPLKDAYRSEREDWIQSMVMAGMGICFLPEFSPTMPGLHARRVIEPEVVREVSLVTVSGRRFSPAVTTFVRALKAYKWPT